MNQATDPSGNTASVDSDAGGRLRIEYRNGDDFPFYNGRPIPITGSQWWIVMAAVALGFLALTLIPLDGPILSWIPIIGFIAIPLVGLWLVARDHWTALFRKVRGRDVGWMFGFAALNIVVTFAVGLVVKLTVGAATNPIIGTIAELSVGDRIMLYLRTAPQLLGEEIVTILPFLAILWLVYSRGHLSRKSAVVTAWLVSAFIFGALHLPTYDWNFVQSFVIIGAARLVLTLAYIKTKNIWVSTGAHIINDWVLMTTGLAGATLLLT